MSAIEQEYRKCRGLNGEYGSKKCPMITKQRSYMSKIEWTFTQN